MKDTHIWSGPIWKTHTYAADPYERHTHMQQTHMKDTHMNRVRCALSKAQRDGRGVFQVHMCEKYPYEFTIWKTHAYELMSFICVKDTHMNYAWCASSEAQRHMGVLRMRACFIWVCFICVSLSYGSVAYVCVFHIGLFHLCHGALSEAQRDARRGDGRIMRCRVWRVGACVWTCVCPCVCPCVCMRVCVGECAQFGASLRYSHLSYKQKPHYAQAFAIHISYSTIPQTDYTVIHFHTWHAPFICDIISRTLLYGDSNLFAYVTCLMHMWHRISYSTILRQ